MAEIFSPIMRIAEFALAWIGLAAILLALAVYLLIELGIVSWRAWKGEKIWSALMKFGNDRQYRQPKVNLEIDINDAGNIEVSMTEQIEDSAVVREEKNKILKLLIETIGLVPEIETATQIKRSLQVVHDAIDRATPNRFASDKVDEVRSILISIVQSYRNANANANIREVADLLDSVIAELKQPA